MRCPATEKLEIIRLVEQSPLPARHTLTKLGHSAGDLLPLPQLWIRGEGIPKGCRG